MGAGAECYFCVGRANLCDAKQSINSTDMCSTLRRRNT